MNRADYERYIARYNLKRFVDAHHQNYANALEEIQRGQKRSHWMWYIFPQLRGLGRSSMANYYGIVDEDEAMMYLQHPVLGRHLFEITKEMLAINNKSIEDVLGEIDALKFRSSMTLFDMIYPNSIFSEALQKYYKGEADQLTIRLLQRTSENRDRLIPGGIIGAIIGGLSEILG